MSFGTSAARIQIHFNVHRPIELTDLNLSFLGLARRYRKFLLERAKENGLKQSDTDVKLYVTKIESNCILAELSGAVEILGTLFTVMDYKNIFIDFVKNTKNTIDYYRGIAQSGEVDVKNLPDSKGELGAITDWLKTVDIPGSDMKLSAIEYASEETEESKRTLFSVSFTDEETAEARKGALLAQRALDERGEADHKNVLMFLFQTNTDEPRSQGTTADRAVIKAISDKPLRLYFASELDQDRMYTFKNDPESNPFKASYIVDVNVETDRNDKPVTYRVVRLREIIPDDDEEDTEKT